jgi:hypothetical protein
MALNVAVQLYRGTRASLASLASTGHAGVLAWTTDSNEFFVDQGSGTAGIGNEGSGAAWIAVGNSIGYFTAANQAAMVALAAKVGDLCDRTDLKQIFILTASPASSAGNWQAISPDASVTGIQGLSSGTAHQFVSFIGTDGTQHLTQPSFADISGSLTQTQLPASIGAGSSLTSIDCGTF